MRHSASASLIKRHRIWPWLVIGFLIVIVTVAVALLVRPEEVVPEERVGIGELSAYQRERCVLDGGTIRTYPSPRYPGGVEYCLPYDVGIPCIESSQCYTACIYQGKPASNEEAVFTAEDYLQGVCGVKTLDQCDIGIIVHPTTDVLDPALLDSYYCE